jgi:cytidylate kinase
MILLRGLPGSGKTTLANKIRDKYKYVTMCSGDAYFTDPLTGKYNFDLKRLKNAHEYAQNEAEIACKLDFLTSII